MVTVTGTPVFGREESQPQPTMVLPSKSSKKPSGAAARAVNAPPMRNIAMISKVVRVVLFFNIKSFLSFPRFVTWIALRKNEIIDSHKINICNKFVIYER